MTAKLFHRGFEAHARAGRLLVEHHREADILEQRKANALLLHLLHQQANIKQLVDLVHAPVT